MRGEVQEATQEPKPIAGGLRSTTTTYSTILTGPYVLSLFFHALFAFSLNPRSHQGNVLGEFEILFLPAADQSLELLFQCILGCRSGADCCDQVLVATEIERKEIGYSEVPRGIVVLPHTDKQCPPMARLQVKNNTLPHFSTDFTANE